MTLQLYLINKPDQIETTQTLNETQKTLYPCHLMSCEIFQKEQKVAQAVLTIYHENDSDLTTYSPHEIEPHQSIQIVFEAENVSKIIFQGTLSSSTNLQDKGLVQYILTSQPLQNKVILEKIKTDLLSNQCSVIEEFSDDPTISSLLETQSRVLYWDRFSQNIQTSCLFKGTEQFYVNEEHIFENSLKIKQNPYAIQHIECCVEAIWNRKLSGFLNLSHFLNQSTYQTFISTLTPKGLIQKWPKVDLTIHSHQETSMTSTTGYRVVKSDLQKIIPPALSGYPTMTTPFSIQNSDKIEPLCLSYQWFQPHLRLLWMMEQKVHEYMSFSVQTDCKETSQDTMIQTKKLIFRVQNSEHYLNHPSDSTLFQNSKGKKLIDHAFKVALNHLRTAQRNIEISFTCLWEKGIDVHLDMSVTLHHPSFKDKSMTGKVIEYRMFYEFDCSYIWIKMACSSKPFNEDKFTPPSWNWKPIDTSETSPLIQTSELTPHYFIESFQILNDAFEQEAFLKQTLGNIPSTFKNMCSLLKQKPTQIHLKLKPIHNVQPAFLKFEHQESLIF